MNLADLSSKIATRLTSDTGAGGMFATGAFLINDVFFDVTLAGASAPYIIVTFPEAPEDDVFNKDAIFPTVEFEVVCERRLGTFTQDSAVLDRLRNLFHRWQPTLAGNYTGTAMIRRTGTTNHDADFRRYIEQYQVRVEWNTIGPV